MSAPRHFSAADESIDFGNEREEREDGGEGGLAYELYDYNLDYEDELGSSGLEGGQVGHVEGVAHYSPLERVRAYLVVSDPSPKFRSSPFSSPAALTSPSLSSSSRQKIQAIRDEASQLLALLARTDQMRQEVGLKLAQRHENLMQGSVAVANSADNIKIRYAEFLRVLYQENFMKIGKALDAVSKAGPNETSGACRCLIDAVLQIFPNKPLGKQFKIRTNIDRVVQVKIKDFNKQFADEFSDHLYILDTRIDNKRNKESDLFEVALKWTTAIISLSIFEKEIDMKTLSKREVFELLDALLYSKLWLRFDYNLSAAATSVKIGLGSLLKWRFDYFRSFLDQITGFMKSLVQGLESLFQCENLKLNVFDYVHEKIAKFMRYHVAKLCQTVDKQYFLESAKNEKLIRGCNSSDNSRTNRKKHDRGGVSATGDSSDMIIDTMAELKSRNSNNSNNNNNYIISDGIDDSGSGECGSGGNGWSINSVENAIVENDGSEDIMEIVESLMELDYAIIIAASRNISSFKENNFNNSSGIDNSSNSHGSSNGRGKDGKTFVAPIDSVLSRRACEKYVILPMLLDFSRVQTCWIEQDRQFILAALSSVCLARSSRSDDRGPVDVSGAFSTSVIFDKDHLGQCEVDELNQYEENLGNGDSGLICYRVVYECVSLLDLFLDRYMVVTDTVQLGLLFELVLGPLLLTFIGILAYGKRRALYSNPNSPQISSFSSTMNPSSAFPTRSVANTSIETHSQCLLYAKECMTRHLSTHAGSTRSSAPLLIPEPSVTRWRELGGHLSRGFWAPTPLADKDIAKGGHSLGNLIRRSFSLGTVVFGSIALSEEFDWYSLDRCEMDYVKFDASHGCREISFINIIESVISIIDSNPSENLG